MKGVHFSEGRSPGIAPASSQGPLARRLTSSVEPVEKVPK